jgi:hypothetical protein
LKRTTAIFLLLLTPILTPAFAQITGNVTVGSGYLAHPVGVNDEPEAAYVYQMLTLGSVLKQGAHAFKVGYEGQASQFGNDTQLGSQRHGLGVEWFHNSADRRTGLSAGVQGAMRRHEDWYQAYDHEEAFAYAAFKKFSGGRTLWKGYAGYRVRQYDQLPEESYLEPHVQFEVQRFSESRSSLGLRVRYGYKKFNDEAAPQVWETPNLPSTSQLAARLSFSRGLSERTGLRTWAEYRWKLSEFPHYVADDVYDSPVLDRYATEGFDVFAALKTLAPWQWWLELGASLGDHDYGEIQFAALDGGGQSRQDTVSEYYLSLQKTLARTLGQPRFNLMAGWRNQDSTHDWYEYSGVFASSNLSWKF